MPPYWSDGDCAVHLGDCREVLAEMPEASVDSIVTDPPYEYAFMGRRWDSTGVAFDVATWEACLRVLKPGGHLLAFGAPRTWHRLAVAIEDAGFEIRDSLQWVYGSGFPKSLDVSKAIDKAAGAEREPDEYTGPNHRNQVFGHGMGGGITLRRGAPTTEEAARWDGWGTALKPGWEPIILARKPLAGTVAATVLEHGTGALNIDASRVPLGGERPPTGSGDRRGSQVYAQDEWTRTRMSNGGNVTPAAGRWPTNLVFSHSPECVEDEPCAPDCPVAELDRQSGDRPGGWFPGRPTVEPGSANGTMNGGWSGTIGPARRLDGGGASRFFPTFRYEAKAPASERPKLARTVMRLRPDLTDEQRAHVLAELRKAGVNVG